MKRPRMDKGQKGKDHFLAETVSVSSEHFFGTYVLCGNIQTCRCEYLHILDIGV